MMIPTSDTALVNNLVCREILDPQGPLDPPSPTIALLKNTVAAIATGSDIAPYKAELQRITANRPEKSGLVLAQLSQIDEERIPGFVEMQDYSERILRRATRRSEMSVAEALAVWRLANQELTVLRKSKSDSKEHTVDSVTVMDKIDVSSQHITRTVAHKWEQTSPLGREVIRKKIWELKREMAKDAIQVESKVEPSA